MKVVIYWFKRDLRIMDNVPLLNSINSGYKVIPLFVLEPELWKQKELSLRQYLFQLDCLLDLKKQLNSIGGKLIIKTGSVFNVFESLSKIFQIQAIYSHQETWNYWTYQRDIEFRVWTKRKQIPWIESVQNGVIRGLKDRDKWGLNWLKLMKTNQVIAPLDIKSVKIKSDNLPKPVQLDLKNDNFNLIQKGGRTEAIKLLSSFTNSRGKYYQIRMSSPLTAMNSCSRLSAHLAFGTISMKEVFQKAESVKGKLDKEDKIWRKSINAFLSRLRWHCHFIQKLEDEPSLEFKPMNRMYEGLRENSNLEFLKLWKNGETGYPMIDACMRCLNSTGWLNFRMRAMLVSFACNNLWIDWKIVAENLGQLFVDYEPGIHYPQVQMQACITGINSVRIYNPIKQGVDHDPNGVFIKKWIPELRETPNEIIHTPWVDKLNTNYKMPVIDESTSRKDAARKIFEIRNKKNHSSHTAKILKKHGSRKNKSKGKVKNNSKQLELFL